MIIALLALGVVLLALPGVRRLPPDRLPLQEWVPVATVSLLLGLLSVETALALIALPTLAHASGAAAIADSCHDVLAPLPTTPTVLGWLGGVAAAAVAIRFMAATRVARLRARDARAEPWLGRHHELGEYDLVVLPSEAPLAFGAPGVPPQVLLSEGLVERVPPDALDAIVRHEAAHHRLSHDRYLGLLVGVERTLGLLPPVRRSSTTIRDALEVWADQAASRDAATRRSLRRALVALAGAHPAVMDRARRLERRLVARTPAFRVLWYAPVAFLAATALLLAVAWLTDPHHAGALALDCSA